MQQLSFSYTSDPPQASPIPSRPSCSLTPLTPTYPSQTFLLASSTSLSRFPLSSRSSATLLLSFSLKALSYLLPSSLVCGLTPNAPAIIRPAAALLFSGLLSRLPALTLDAEDEVGGEAKGTE